MPAATAATITTSQMVCGGEDHQDVFKVKITGLHFGPGLMGAVPGRHTRPAKAGLVAPIRRHLREQGFGDFDLRAPAGAFVGGRGAQLAVIELAAQGAHIGFRWGWSNVHISRLPAANRKTKSPWSRVVRMDRHRPNWRPPGPSVRAGGTPFHRF